MTRGELSKIFGKEVSRDAIDNLRGGKVIRSGPRSPTRVCDDAAPSLGLRYRDTETLLDLLDVEALEDVALLSRRVIEEKGERIPDGRELS